MTKQQFGVVGMAVMGKNLALNIESRGYTVALYNRTGSKTTEVVEEHPDKKGNIRDYASINELICLSNMENINAVLIEDGLSQKERLIKLNKIAIHQMSILEEQYPMVLK